MKVLSLVITLSVLDCSLATLSKSDSKRSSKPKGPAKPPGSAAPTDDSSSASDSVSFSHEFDDAAERVPKEFIIDDSSKLEYTGKRRFRLPTLAYVTPWNSRGYDIAKWQASKFDIIVPVWFQVLPPSQAAPEDGCRIAGLHDIDQGWIEDVRSNNSDVKIVPRFNVEQHTPNDLQTLFSNIRMQEKCIWNIINLLLRNRFDGAVIELWLSVIAMSRGTAGQVLHDFLLNFAELLRTKDLITVVPVPPSIGEDGHKPSGLFNAEHFVGLVPYVDYFSLMTYDFPNKGIGPVAPIQWQSACLQYLIDAAEAKGYPDAHKRLLLGMNMYGYTYIKGKDHPEAIVGDRYMKLLKEPDAQFTWDRKAAEHYVHTRKETVYFPSIYSLRVRLRLAADTNVGVAMWDIGQGLDHFYNEL